MHKIQISLAISVVFALALQTGAVCPFSCETGDEQWNRMEVLPGSGWDNLRNKEMNLVFEYDYSQCQLTNDRKFLLPDGCSAIPVKQSKVESASTLIEHWDEHTSLTSATINLEAKYSAVVKVSGKFSAEYMTAKTTMHQSKSSIARAQMRYKLYIIQLHLGSKLHPVFKDRLLDIASYMISNNSQIARYLSELLVRDYGTHYITNVHAGAILVQEDYISNDYLTKNKNIKAQIKASVSADFLGKIHFGADVQFSVKSKDASAYRSMREYSHVRTYGGIAYGANFTTDEWVNGLANNLVAIDREGVPLHFAIRPEILTSLPPSQTLKVAQYVESAITSYYKHNTILGCTDPKDKNNFNFGANVDDHSCSTIADSFPFGGVYQTCEDRGAVNNAPRSVCSMLVQKNPLTNDFSCPTNYMSILLNIGTKSDSYTTDSCHDHCETLDLYLFEISYSCRKECSKQNHIITGNYETYWCVATENVNKVQKLLFGGIYSSSAINPITLSRACPTCHSSVRFGEDSHLCLTDYSDLAVDFSIDFAGFQGCLAGNPLATKTSTGTIRAKIGELETSPGEWPYTCPNGYTPYLASTGNDCEVTYCLKITAFKEVQLPPVNLPPYRKHGSLNEHTYAVPVIVSANGDVWTQSNVTKEWIRKPYTSPKERKNMTCQTM